MARTKHPEAEGGEVWIGNMHKKDFPKVGWRTKRMGAVAYFVSGRDKGERIPKSQAFAPCFVQRSELAAAGIVIPRNNRPIDHRW